ncbi:MAG: hypothetical protein EDS66_14980 [Planctomycetota bacterium]|nr:MAG: hypothetical protein EDS66_14980 [Planctomycetota bacterium]MCQ3922420.1 hypothetical protein [Planctomycetota bacterium]
MMRAMHAAAWVCVAILAADARAEIPIKTTLRDFFQGGSQPDGGYDQFLHSQNCGTCHGSVEENVRIMQPWEGSMMAHAARDPLFYACLAIAEQDAQFVGDICIRCHTPRAWLSGRSNPTDGSAINASDRDSVNCNLCHRMVDPVYEKGVNPVEDVTVLNNLLNIPADFSGGKYVMDPRDRRRGPRATEPPHSFLHSPFHKEAQLCGTCHDVSNPAYTRQPDDTYVLNELDTEHPTDLAYDQFPLERTFSEWLASDFARGGIDMGGRFGGNRRVISTCQDCHMPAVDGAACDFGDPPVYSDLASHELVGGNAWVGEMIINLYPNEVNADALIAGMERARDMLRRSLTLEAAQDGDLLRVRIINETGHKLPSGYPEGRRMWIQVECRDADGDILAEFGGYDWDRANLSTGDTKVYEAKLGLDQAVADLTGLPVGEGFHFALNNVVYKDNRIPPRGFNNDVFKYIQAGPVAKGYSDGQYWDDTAYRLPVGTTSATVRVYYQTASKDYILFLRDENRTNSAGQVLYDQWRQTGKSPPVEMAAAEVEVAWFNNGDFDGDGGVGLYDHALDTGCMTGPVGGPIEPECEPADLNGDADVDLEDWSRFQNRYGG